MGQTTKSPTTKFTTKSRAIAASAFDRITIGWLVGARAGHLSDAAGLGRAGQGRGGAPASPPLPLGQVAGLRARGV